jgi:putative phosphoribosyl transferase
MGKVFEDREEAGRMLVEALIDYKDRDDVIILAIPRGGIEIAAPIARALRVPLDIIVTRKIGAPDNEEFAIGALSEMGDVFLNTGVISSSGYSDEEVKAVIDAETMEAEERVKKYRGHKLPPLKGKTVLLVDDGLATGSTMLVAAKAVKAQKPAKLVVAVPVAPPDSVAKIEEIADEVIALQVSSFFFAVGQFYRNFTQTTDEDVEKLMKSLKK